ncbi:MAG: AraC family transcriptional regulator [Clostridia bacterium]|nr:AraC family transcriptional regulator [Clostridia bacterium]
MRTTYEALQMYSYPISVQKFIAHNSMDHVHWHEEIEILYFVKGTGVISCNLQDYTINAGDIAIFNGNELHTGCIRGYDTIYYCIHINTGFFHNLIGNEYVIFRNIITNSECAELLNKVIEETWENGFEHFIAIKKIMYEFFCLISKLYVNSILSEEDYKKQFNRLDTFNSIIEYIDYHYDEELNVTALADRFFMSPSYFAHLFKKQANKSVTEYVNEVRINHAKAFLETEELSVGAIACRVGFNDINYFSRKFKAITGMTPTEYMRMYKI